MAEESLKLFAYKDDQYKKGRISIGYGTKAKKMDDRISPLEAERELEKVLKQTIKEYGWLEEKCPFEINEVRREALCDMIFNLGLPTFKEFKKTIKLIINDNPNDWHFVAAEMRDSKWFDQVRKRAQRILYEIDTGEFKGE